MWQEMCQTVKIVVKIRFTRKNARLLIGMHQVILVNRQEAALSLRLCGFA
jgi:hypothetical protein